MKNIVLIVFLLSSLLFSSTEVKLDSKYREALQAYKTKDFAKSYELLSTLYLTNLSDAKVNFYLGRSAFEIGNYEIALASFERAEMLDPSNLRIKLEMAKSYFMLKMYENAEIKFKEVLDNPMLPENVRRNVELYLSRVTKVQKKSFTYTTLSADFLYDSNVNYASLSPEYHLTIGTYPADTKQDDLALQVSANVINIYDIGDKGGYSIKNKVSAYMKKYSDLSDYDVSYLSYIPSLIYSERKYTLELAATFDLLYLASDPYLNTMAISPIFEYSHSNTLRSTLYYKYFYKNFHKIEQSGLDAHHNEAGYSLQKILSPRSYVQGNILGTIEEKVGGTRIDVDYVEFKSSLIYANQFSKLFGTEMYGEYRQRGYTMASTLYNSYRLDISGLASVSLNAKVYTNTYVNLKGMYNRVESNQDRYSYEKYIFSIGINTTF